MKLLLRQSVLVIADQVAVGSMTQRAINGSADSLAHEPDRSVTEEEVGPSRMIARETAHVAGRKVPILDQCAELCQIGRLVERNPAGCHSSCDGVVIVDRRTRVPQCRHRADGPSQTVSASEFSDQDCERRAIADVIV